MTALLITWGALLVAMLGCAVLRPKSLWSNGDAEEQARMMAAIAMSVV
jgi:hypothetical protein